jgi:four helix bundle protein
LESQLIISEKIGILKSEDLIVLSAQIDEISKMIVGLRKSLK